jgi:hypothetical protein
VPDDRDQSHPNDFVKDEDGPSLGTNYKDTALITSNDVVPTYFGPSLGWFDLPVVDSTRINTILHYLGPTLGWVFESANPPPRGYQRWQYIIYGIPASMIIFGVPPAPPPLPMFGFRHSPYVTSGIPQSMIVFGFRG